MTRVAYNGHEALTFTDYTDLETGRMLHAEPGGTYDIAPASGRAAPEIPEPWFTPLRQDEGAAAEGDAASARGGKKNGGEAIPAPQDEHGTEEG